MSSVTEADESHPLRRPQMPPWRPIALLFCLLVGLLAAMAWATNALILIPGGLAGGYVIMSYGLAGGRERKATAAICALVGAAWACAVGYGAYWSSWERFERVDVAVVWLGCLITQVRISGLKVGWRLGAHAVFLLAVIATCYAFGLLARGFSEDPRM